MIDTANESLLTLKQAADVLPRRRRGRKVHACCTYRWTTVGCGTIVLERTATARKEVWVHAAADGNANELAVGSTRQ